MNADKRTVAFQVPGELFEKFKDYLQEKGIKQNAFFLDCIQRALAEDRFPDGTSDPDPETQETAQTE